jgi:hypothetical protein
LKVTRLAVSWRRSLTMTSATTLESIDEICFANFFMAHACPLQFGIRAAGARSSSRADFELVVREEP